MSSLYELLDSHPQSSPEELKKSYRRLARQYHPDANPDDPAAEAKFKEISHAYEVLSDPERRAHYDRFGVDPSVGGGGQGGGFDTGFGDIFEAFFGGMGGSAGRVRRGPQFGQDAEIRIGISLREACFGVERTLEVSLPVHCDDCQGTGARVGTTPERCNECGGAGEVRRVRQSLLGQMVTSSPCMRCQATGEIIASPCERCRGDGRVTATKSLTLDIPPGVDTGTQMRLADRGPAGPRGGPNGNLFVQLIVEDDPEFQREGDDLHREVHLSMTQVALGAEVEVETLDGTTTLNVPHGTQPGHVTRVKGEGITHLKGRGRGDLYLHVVVDVPTSLTEREEELLRELANLRGESVAQHEEPGLFNRLRSAFS